MVCTGARTEELSKKAAQKIARVVNRIGFEVKFKDFKVQNIVGSCDVKFPIRLEVIYVLTVSRDWAYLCGLFLQGLAYEHEDHASYEPELFPGLIYRMISPKVRFLPFSIAGTPIGMSLGCAPDLRVR